ncbi:hypothetical protein NONO_c22030 [Nocardia nova SH22a]|uniref:Uncharacterized protein n=1 Tax=Nocardia nova SH22a TaxID=1415166 RepID=W5TIF1_9NOCA|nr:hypothetical protein [Nocardia nova]AHH17001.1 hypothetical protein NONO_c22030 [Nocardia nova SH22a]
MSRTTAAVLICAAIASFGSLAAGPAAANPVIPSVQQGLGPNGCPAPPPADGRRLPPPNHNGPPPPGHLAPHRGPDGKPVPPTGTDGKPCPPPIGPDGKPLPPPPGA